MLLRLVSALLFHWPSKNNRQKKNRQDFFYLSFLSHAYLFLWILWITQYNRGKEEENGSFRFFTWDTDDAWSSSPPRMLSKASQADSLCSYKRVNERLVFRIQIVDDHWLRQRIARYFSYSLRIQWENISPPLPPPPSLSVYVCGKFNMLK